METKFSYVRCQKGFDSITQTEEIKYPSRIFFIIKEISLIPKFGLRQIILYFPIIFVLLSENSNSQPLSFTELNLGQLSSSSQMITASELLDIDNDGDLDIFYGFNPEIGFFRQNADKSFTKATISSSVVPYRYVWGDYDLDNDLDLFISNKIYQNDGTGNFTGNVIPELENKSVEGLDLGDADNDGDLDLACIMADKNSTGYFLKILFNNNGSFSRPYYEIQSEGYSNVKWVDLNKDNQLDLVLHSRSSTKIYLNQNLEFLLVSTLTSTAYVHCELKITDYDGDSDPDIIASGEIILNNCPSFSKVTPLTTFAPNLIETTDADNDGDPDLLYLFNSSTGILYTYNAGTYQNSDISFPIFYNAGADWGDYDKDGDVDLVVAYNTGSGLYLKIYRNDISSDNSTPLPPSTINSSVSGNEVVLTWNQGSDFETPANSLFYNVFVTKTGSIIKSPEADMSNGFILHDSKRNMQQDQTCKITGLSAGTYTWSVQAIDQGAKGSAFTASASFNITLSNSISPSASQSIKPNTNGSALTVSVTGSFDSHDWAYSLKHGGPYTSLGNGTDTYVPNFPNPGDYYVVCKSMKGTEIATSNEVKVSVLFFEVSEIPGLGSSSLRKIERADFDNDEMLDLLLIADNNSASTALYRNNSGTFEVASGFSPPAMTNSASTCFDYNNDGLIDILITGDLVTGDYALLLYKNTGSLTFAQAGSFSNGSVKNGSLANGDYNNDGLTDFIVNGVNIDNEPITKIFQNMGNDLFSDIGANISPVSNGTTQWIDLNRDSFPDIFLTGTDLSGNPSTKYYINNKKGGFVLSGLSFKNLKESNASFGDYNNDGFIDIVITGNDPDGMHTYVYKNNEGTSFQEIQIIYNNSTFNSSFWFDYDNDKDLDLLMISDNPKRDPDILTENLIFKNTGSDNFVKDYYVQSQMTYLGYSALIICRHDNDTDADFIQSVYDPISHLNKLMIFSNLTPTVKNLPAIPSDLNQSIVGNDVILRWKNNDPEGSGTLTYNVSIHNGSTFSFNPQANISNGYRRISEKGRICSITFIVKNLPRADYTWRVQAIDNSLNTSAFSVESGFEIDNIFAPASSDPFTDVNSGDADWGDYDNDGDLDLVIAGSSSGGYITQIYKNTDGVFTNANIPLTGFHSYMAMFSEWADINNDNNLDLILFGNTTSSSSSGRKLIVYLNNGGDNFTSIYTFSVPDNFQTCANYGDIDNDGDIDFVISPYRIIINNGNLSFTEKMYTSIYGNYLALEDTDNDLDNDIINISHSSSGLFLNNGNLSFTHISNPFPGLQTRGEIKCFDYNNDKYTDLLITGLSNNYYITKLLENNGNNTFSELNSILKGTLIGNTSYGDFNNDGDFDFLISGKNSLLFTELYDNLNLNTYNHIEGDIQKSYYEGGSAMGDYDKDGDLDLIITGYDDAGLRSTTLYNNTKNFPNTKPAAPGNLRFERSGLGVILSWDDANDDESIDGGLSYNIRIGTSPNGYEIVAPMSFIGPESNENSGYRKIAKPGNAQFKNSFKLNELPVDTYYWSVQAVDHSFTGGTWAPEQSFTITDINADFSATEVCRTGTTEFTDLSIPHDIIISNWDWNFGDGSTSTERNPKHIYNVAGTYNVELVTSYMKDGIKTFGGSITKSVFVREKPDASFTANVVCQGTETSFTNNTDLNGLTVSSWYWDFGNGKASTQETPLNPGLLIAGDYNVKLRVTTSEFGCMDEITKTVTVAAYPSAIISVSGPLKFCSGDSVSLAVPKNNSYLYSWKLDGLGITNADSYLYRAKQSGNYSVEVVNPVGNCTQTSGNILVSVAKAPLNPVINTIGSNIFCEGDSVKLFTSYNATLNYQWLLNGGSVGSDSNLFVAKTSGSYDIIVTNSSGCSATSLIPVVVVANPMPALSLITVKGDEKFCSGESANLSVPAVKDYTYSWKKGTGVLGLSTNSIDVAESGSYTVEMDLGGCKLTAEPVTIEVVAKPARPDIDSGSYSPPMCLGENPLRLSVDKIVPGYAYQWYKNETPVSTETFVDVVEAGNYYLEAVADICPSERSSLSVTFAPAPLKPVIFPAGPTVWYLSTTSTAASYKWYLNGSLIPGATGSSYMAGQNFGIYRLAIANENGCYSFSDTLRIPTFRTTGIEDTDPFEDVRIYPNPTTGLFTIEMNNNVFGELVIDIISQNGSKILNIKFDKSTEHFMSQIDLSGQPNGMYLINLSLDKFQAVGKVVLE